MEDSLKADTDQLIWKQAEMQVHQIPVVPANFRHIADTGRINGSLHQDMTRLIYHQLQLSNSNHRLTAQLSALREERHALKADLSHSQTLYSQNLDEITKTHKELQRVYKLVDTHFNLCSMAERERDESREQNKAIVEERDKLKAHALELVRLIHTMHKPEYATFFVGQPATDEANQMNGYELAEKYETILGEL